jgi:hypothetical protein
VAERLIKPVFALTSTSEVSPNYAPSAANTTTGTVNVNALNAAFDSATYYGAIFKWWN